MPASERALAPPPFLTEKKPSKLTKRSQSALLQNVITTFGRISSDVSQCPDCLLAHVQDGGAEQLDEDGYGARFDDDLGVLRGARGDVG